MLSILANTVEQSKKASLHQVQLSLITERERKEEIFKMVFAFEDFVRRYGQYHLNESVSQLNIANNKLGKWKYFNLNYSNLGKKDAVLHNSSFFPITEYSNLYFNNFEISCDPSNLPIMIGFQQGDLFTNRANFTQNHMFCKPMVWKTNDILKGPSQ